MRERGRGLVRVLLRREVRALGFEDKRRSDVAGERLEIVIFMKTVRFGGTGWWCVICVDLVCWKRSEDLT